MKKVLFKLIFLFITFFVVLTNNMLVLADVSSYTVYSIKSDSSKMQIGEVTTDYEEARKLMNEYSNSINDELEEYDEQIDSIMFALGFKRRAYNELFMDTVVRHIFTYEAQALEIV